LIEFSPPSCASPDLIRGFVARIHVLRAAEGVDGRDEPGHDDRVVARMSACAIRELHPGFR
jgi:hypothetical protein